MSGHPTEGFGERFSTMPNLLGYVVILVFSAFVFLLYGLDLPFQRDNAIYYYSAQQLLQGVPPYLSIFDIKTPLASFVTAMFLWPSEALFDEPLHGVRIGFMLLVTGTAILLYRLASRMFGQTPAILVPPLGLLGFQGLIVFAAMGARPKVLLLFFMAAALVYLWDRRWFAAGVASGCCAFTWQPAGIVLIGALAGALLDGAEGRIRRLTLLCAGAGLVAAVISAFFLANGAFSAFFDGTFRVHLFIERGDQQEVRILAKGLDDGFPYASSLIILGLGSLVVHLVGRAAGRVNDPECAPCMAYLIMLGMFIAWSFFDVQSYVDLFVFLPFAALGLQVLVTALAQGFRSDAAGGKRAHGAILLMSILYLLALPLLARLSHPPSRDGLAAQRDRFESLAALAPGRDGARILAIEIPELPAVLRRDNLTPYVVNLAGIDRYVASRFPGGFDDYVASLEAARPDLVVVRMRHVMDYALAHREALVAWLETGFEPATKDSGVSVWVPRRTPESGDESLKAQPIGK